MMNEVLPVGRRATSVQALVAVVLSAASVGCLYSPQPAPQAQMLTAYPVGAPDILRVNILPEPVIDTQVVVRPDGMISVDLIGDVPAEGRSVEEIARDIEKRISRFKRGATATVALVEARSNAVTVLGEVRMPRSFALLKETRVSEAMGQVGGATAFARKGKVKVVRSGRGETVVFTVDLNAIQHGDLTTDIELASGDLVYVPPTIVARVGYLVQQVLFPFQPFLGVLTSAMGTALVK